MSREEAHQGDASRQQRSTAGTRTTENKASSNSSRLLASIAVAAHQSQAPPPVCRGGRHVTSGIVSPSRQVSPLPTARFAAPTTFSARPPTRPSHGPGPALRCPPYSAGNPTQPCNVSFAWPSITQTAGAHTGRTDAWDRAAATWPHLVWPEACKTHVAREARRVCARCDGWATGSLRSCRAIENPSFRVGEECTGGS